MKIIAICNQKGGVGKTTSSVNISAALAAFGYKTLLIDLDPQGNASSGLGLNKYRIEKSIYHAIIGACPLSSVICRTDVENLSIAPSNRNLVGAELELVTVLSRETKLKSALKEVADDYDYVLIDCPPSLGLLTVNALTAAESVIVPVQCQFYALEGLSELVHTIDSIHDCLNPDLHLGGIILTMFDGRSNLTHQVVNEVRSYFKEKVFNTVIPCNVKLSESPSHGMPIHTYDPRSKGAEAYSKLAEEVVHNSAQIQKNGLVLVNS